MGVVAAMLTPGLVVWAKFVDVPRMRRSSKPSARQWNWSFRLPGDDGVLGTVDPGLIGPDNPYGMAPTTPGRER